MYKNIYDMAGNMREFTTEIYIDNRTSTQLNVLMRKSRSCIWYYQYSR